MATEPYMHAGQFDTLEQVIDCYDRGGDAPPMGTKNPCLAPAEARGKDLSRRVCT